MPLRIPAVTVTAEEVWEYTIRRLTNLSDVRAALIDALATPANFMADVSGLAPAGEYDTEIARITAARATLIDALGTPANFMATVPALSDLKVYPWAADAVLDADPDYTYTAEVSEAGTDYVEVSYFDFDENTANIKSMFVNLVWGQKITGAGSGKVKWQIASGSNASPGAYTDITDEISETLTDHNDHGRSGVIHKITGSPSQTPFTIRCVVKNVDATSAEAKIKSNSYIRVAYKRVS